MIIVRGSYRSAERIFIWLTIPFFAYPVAAILAHPDWGDVARGVVAPHIHASSAYLLLFIATAGTTITPYMQLYLQSAVVERGRGEEGLPDEKREAVAGAIFADLIAAFIIIATGATLFTHGIHSGGSARPTPPRLPSPATTPKRCSASACSARASWPPPSCRLPPPTSWPSRWGSRRGSPTGPARPPPSSA